MIKISAERILYNSFCNVNSLLGNLRIYILEGEKISAPKAVGAYFRRVYPRCERLGRNSEVRWKWEILGIFMPGQCENIDFCFNCPEILLISRLVMPTIQVLEVCKFWPHAAI